MLPKPAPWEASAAPMLAKVCAHWPSKSAGVLPSLVAPTWPAMNRNSEAFTRVICEYCPSGLPRLSGLRILMSAMVHSLCALPTIPGSGRLHMTEKPRGALTVRISAMPADTNANGDIFGGWVLSRMDQAGGIAGVERARGRVVPIALEAMTFIRPVRVGDVLEVYTEVESIGRTSMKMHIEAWARRFQTHVQEKVTDATFNFVAMYQNGPPRPIPKETG